jgi:O-antigen/teichoic acid export membrane protein
MWNASGTLTITIGRMGIAIVLARCLGPEKFGSLIFLQWLTDMTYMFFSVGLAGVATRFFPQSIQAGSEIIPAFGNWFVQAACLVILNSCVFAGTVSVLFGGQSGFHEIGAVAFLGGTTAFFALATARSQGLFQYRKIAFSSLIYIAMVFFGLVVLRAGQSLTQTVILLGCANGAAGMFLSSDLRNMTGDFFVMLSKDASDHIAKYGKNSWVTSVISSLLWSRGELPLVKRDLGESLVGYYSIALTISGIINQGLSLLIGALWPQIALTWDKGSSEKLDEFSNTLTNLLILIAGVSIGVVICFSPYIVIIMFGSNYLPSADIVATLVLGTLGLTTGCANLVVQAKTDGKFARNISVIGSCALYGLALILIPRFGVQGAAITRVVTQIAIAVATLLWMRKLSVWSSDRHNNLLTFVLVFVLSVLLSIGRSLMPAQEIVGALCLLATDSFIVVLICTNGFRINLLNEVKSLSRLGHE